MDSGQRLTPTGRDRAIGRLRSLTLGTTVASLAGAIGFGVIAAATQPGTAASDTTPTVIATPSPTIRTGQKHSSSDDGSSQQAPPLQAPAVLPTPTTRHAHVTTSNS
jgi:hypothetical protein